jgi:hypothetical protein
VPLLTAKNRESFPSEPNRAQGKGLESDPKSTQLRGRVTVKTTTGILAAFLSTASVFGQQPTPVPTTAQAPTPAPTPGPLQLQEVVQVEGATKDQLYDAALAWFPSVFVSGKAVLQIQNKEAGMLVGSAITDHSFARKILLSTYDCPGRISYNVTVEVKDGRYRFTVNKFIHEGSAGHLGATPTFGELTNAPIPPPHTAERFTADKGDRMKAWDGMKAHAMQVAADLAKSLHAKLAGAATEKPW